MGLHYFPSKQTHYTPSTKLHQIIHHPPKLLKPQEMGLPYFPSRTKLEYPKTKRTTKGH
jgi:hypothetical protein